MFLVLDVRWPFGTVSRTAKKVAKVATAPLWVPGSVAVGVFLGVMFFVSSPYWIANGDDKRVAAAASLTAPITCPFAVPALLGIYLFNDEWTQKCRELRCNLKSIKAVKQD